MMTAVEALNEAARRLMELPTRLRSAGPGLHQVNRADVLAMLADLAIELEGVTEAMERLNDDWRSDDDQSQIPNRHHRRVDGDGPDRGAGLRG